MMIIMMMKVMMMMMMMVMVMMVMVMMMMMMMMMMTMVMMTMMMMMYRDCGRVWHGHSSVCVLTALVGTLICWSRRQCPDLRLTIVVCCCRSRRWIGSFRPFGTGLNVRLMPFLPL